MKDSELEDLLRKYRPVEPPAHMRQRILAAGHVPLTWPWVSAAAALLVLGLTFQLAARNAVAGLHLNLGPSVHVRITEDLANMLGGDLRARELAEFIVVEQQVRREIAGAEPEPAPGSGGVQR